MPDRFSDLTRIWFDTASEDIVWAKHDFSAKFYSRVCFICQQAAEKSLKSYLFSQKVKLIRTHNLMKLLKVCERYDSSYLDLKESCNILTDYYTDTRYPDIWDINRFNEKNLAKDAIRQAERVLAFVKKKI